MNRKILLTMAGLVPMVLASCNGNTGIGRINRDVYKEKTFEEIKTIRDNILKSQTDSSQHTTLKNNVKNGVLTFKYKFVGKGTMRYYDLTLHNVDANVSAGFILSWDLDKQILKAEGEDETSYFIKSKIDDGKYYQCMDLVTGGKEQHVKLDITNDVEDFDTYITAAIDDYCCLAVPLAFSVGAGITGNYEVDFKTIYPYDYNVKSIFTDDTNDLITKFNKDYKDKGYELKTTYGSNDDKSICASINGKGRLEAIHDTDEHGIGDFNIDLFASYKNNFVNQYEIAFSGDRREVERKYTNYKIHYELNMLQDIKAGEYKPDEINEKAYELYTPEI